MKDVRAQEEMQEDGLGSLVRRGQQKYCLLIYIIYLMSVLFHPLSPLKSTARRL